LALPDWARDRRTNEGFAPSFGFGRHQRYAGRSRTNEGFAPFFPSAKGGAGGGSFQVPLPPSSAGAIGKKKTRPVSRDV